MKKFFQKYFYMFLFTVLLMAAVAYATNVLTVFTYDASVSRGDGVRSLRFAGYLVSTDTLLSSTFQMAGMDSTLDFWYYHSTPDTSCMSVLLQYKTWADTWVTDQTLLSADSAYTWSKKKAIVNYFPKGYRLAIIGHAQNGPHTTFDYRIRGRTVAVY